MEWQCISEFHVLSLLNNLYTHPTLNTAAGKIASFFISKLRIFLPSPLFSKPLHWKSQYPQPQFYISFVRACDQIISEFN